MSLRIQLTLTRDSVCMADDIEDHTKIIDIVPQCSTSVTIMDIAEIYLPKIMGFGHTWDCYLDEEKIATIHGNCKEIILSANNPILSDRCKLNFYISFGIILRHIEMILCKKKKRD